MAESYFNGFDQYITEIDGLDIHFIHVKSTNSAAKPLLITHGWPGSVVEFHKVIKPLADPKAYGGNSEDAFSSQLVVGHAFREARPLVRDHLGHQVAAKGIKEEYDTDDGERRPEGPSSRFQNQSNTDDGNHQIGGRR